MIGSGVVAFAAVFLAELPDKTMFASVALTARFKRPLAVWCGVVMAFAVHVTLAVLLGSLLTRLPHRPLNIAVGLLFATGAVLLWRSTSAHEEVGSATPASPLRVAMTGFLVVLLAELGDLTQLATAGLASRTGDPVAVGIGAWLALATVAGLAVSVGRVIDRKLPMAAVRRCAAGVFAVFGVLALIAAL